MTIAPVRVPAAAPPAAREEVDAGFITRTIAFALDCAVINVVAATVAAVVALILSVFHVPHDVRTVLVAAAGIIFVLWTIGYFVTFWTTTGETPGNRVMRIRVTRLDGSRLHPRHALARVAGMILSLPLLWGYIPILVTERRRGVPDLMAGTVVVDASSSLSADGDRPDHPGPVARA